MIDLLLMTLLFLWIPTGLFLGVLAMSNNQKSGLILILGSIFGPITMSGILSLIQS